MGMRNNWMGIRIAGIGMMPMQTNYTHNAYVIELQDALRVAKTRQAVLVFRYRATWDKFAVVSDAIAYYEPDGDDLMSKSELC